MQRDFERDDRRRRMDDDPRDDPRTRYGNEEDQYSREYRRVYGERDLPRRLHDDRPYNQPGYEPEFGRPGARENVNLDPRHQPDDHGYGEWRRRASADRSGREWDQPASGQRRRHDTFEAGRDDWQGGYYGQGRRFSGEPFGRDQEPGPRSGRDFGRPDSGRRDFGEQERRGRYGQPSYGGSASPYDQGDVGSWYGGDTGMGDAGSSQYDSPYSRRSDQQRRGQYQEQGQYGRSSWAGQGSEQRDWSPSGFSGRGPRGYRRSDDRIREDVCEILTRHHQIDASEMDVDVHDGTVILRGTADSGRMRRLTEELVEDIPGVRDVQNELRVNQRTGYGSSGGYGSTSSEAMVDTGTFASDRGGLRETGVPAYGVGVASTSGVSTRSGPGEPGASAGAGPSQHGNRWQIRETMDVVGSDGESIGTVKSVRGTDFLADRPMGRDVFVPFSAVRTVDGERVMLSMRAAEVSHQNWPTPDLTGSNEGPVTR
jgi:osmotically-inducible protein OsmY